MLYRIADEVGATKIALGHHADDFIETLLLNLFFAGALKAMPAKLVSDDGAHVVIRPLVYVGEDEARQYAKECELPIIGCCCPACGDLSLQRQRVKRLLMDLESEHPGVKQSMLKALGNVAPRHLLDTRLNPPADLRATVARGPSPVGTAAPHVPFSRDPDAVRLPVTVSSARDASRRLAASAVVACAWSCLRASRAAQQRPLVTEDPEPIGAGRLLIEGGVDYAHDVEYPVSGLAGNLSRLPTLGVSIGISSIAEFQIDGGFYRPPVDHQQQSRRRCRSC